ncbi:MAG TPA: shikimate kinase [Cryptosporangiaceae bacterium]|nr:shikimate kinase [Cryptosporangiaceae bacterium]
MDEPLSAEDEPPAAPVLRVVLLGLMGSGKTTVGQPLAAHLGAEYRDNDTLLRRATGRSLTQLAHEGTDVLHAAERAVVRGVLAEDPPLVAGAAAAVIEDAPTRALLARRSFPVYLHARPETLVERGGADDHRPWLRPDPLAALRRMYATRDPLYREVAALVVDADQPPDGAVRDILAALAS